MKQTAVDYLYERLSTLYLFKDALLAKRALEEAKEMEKQQIVDANEDSSINELGEFLTGEKYYNQTYKTNKP